MPKTKLGVVICTFNRKSEVTHLLTRIFQEYQMVTSLFVVESSDSSQRLDEAELKKLKNRNPKFSLELITSETRSLPAQKEIGLLRVLEAQDIGLVMFLDDDTYLSSEAAQEMSEILMCEPDLAAISGVTQRSAGRVRPIHKLFKRIFFLDSNREGVLLPSGINIPVRELSHQLVFTEWLIGCSMWKTKILKSAVFPSQLPGSALYEDVIISQHGRKEGKIAVAPWLLLEHYESKTNRPDAYLHGVRNQRNRFELTKITGSGVTPLGFWWSSTGIIVEQLVLAIISLLKAKSEVSARHAMFLLGSLRGSINIILGKKPS